MSGLDSILARAQAADLVAPPAAAMGAPAAASPEAAMAAARAQQATALAKELGDLLTMASAIVKPAMPRVAAIYTPETCATVGNAVAPVCVKRGWLAGGLAGAWGEEIGAAIVLVPLSIATVQAAKQDLEAMKPQPAGKGAQGAAHGGDPAGAASAPAQPAHQAAGQERKREVVLHPTGAPPKGWEAAATKQPED